MMVLWVLLALSLVSVSMTHGLCMQEHIQTQLCNAHYVVRVKVVSNVTRDVPDLPQRPTLAVKPKIRKTVNKTKKKSILGRMTPKPRTNLAPEPFRFARSIAGTSISRRSSSLGWRYQEIKIKRIFKGVDLVKKNLKPSVQIRSRSNRTVRYKSRLYVGPSIQLEAGEAYILSGQIINKRLYLSMCNWYSTWNSLSLNKIRSLKKILAQGCKCKVRICYQNGCENTKDKSVCWWRPQGYHPESDCRYQYSSCHIHKGNCQWRADKEEYHKCIKDKRASLP